MTSSMTASPPASGGQSPYNCRDWARLVRSVPTGLYVDGSWRESSDGATIAVENPATGETIAEVSSATTVDGATALQAAERASTQWARTPARERGELLRRAFDLLIQRADHFAALISLEMGKPLAQARSEVNYGAEFFRWYAEESVRIDGRWVTSPDGQTRLLTMRQPVGPTLMITPWNFPLAMGTRKIGPAIAAGCTMVIKPASLTPLTTLALADLLEEVGVPAGVLNVIPTRASGEVISPLIADPRLRKLTFTGSTCIGKDLIRQSAEQVLRVSMELGGNAPFLVFEDADLDAAVDGAMLAKMRNMGEACTAANRFLVHESVAEEFAQMLATRMSAEKVGPGIEEGVTVGPLIDAKSRAKVAQLVDDAAQGGAEVVAGGEVVDGPGYFYLPTVLTNVAPGSSVLREEIFGPVAPITTFATDAEAIRRANDTEYGLAAYAFTSSMQRTINVSEDLQFGMIGINQGVISNAAAPFGGIKHSGFGREGGPEGIDEYLEAKYIGINPNAGGAPAPASAPRGR